MKLSQIQEGYDRDAMNDAAGDLAMWQTDEHKDKDWDGSINVLLSDPHNVYKGTMFRFLGQEDINDEFEQSRDWNHSWAKTLKGLRQVIDTETGNGFQEPQGIIIMQTNTGVDVDKVLSRYKYGSGIDDSEEEVIANYNNPTIYGTYTRDGDKVTIKRK